MNNAERAQLWRDMAARNAARRQAQVRPVPVTFAGFPGKAHRLDLASWAKAGRLPEYLANAMFAAVKGKATEARKDDMTPEQMSEWLRFQCVAFCEMMDEPRFSTAETRRARWVASGEFRRGGENYRDDLQEDELDFAEFILECPEVVQEAVQWQLDGCPDIPVLTEGGEMTIEELTSFRDGGGWLATPESYYDGAGVFWQTVASPRVM